MHLSGPSCVDRATCCFDGSRSKSGTAESTSFVYFWRKASINGDLYPSSWPDESFHQQLDIKLLPSLLCCRASAVPGRLHNHFRLLRVARVLPFPHIGDDSRLRL